jgi:EmrB/QacA subfamily drug resistance transporter
VTAIAQKANRSVIILWICLPIFIGAMDLTVVSAVLPQVIFDLEIPLQTGLDEAAWLVTGYLLAYSVALMFMGRLSDIYGRRKVFLISLTVFAVGSYLVAVGETWPFAENRPDPAHVSLAVLIAARMIQAFGAGAMVPVGMALVGDLYPIGERAKPLAVIAAVDTAGWVVGHLYGGIIVRFYDWRTIFWLNLPLCLLAFVMIWKVLRGTAKESASARMDWLGASLIAASLVLLNVGLGTKMELGGAISQAGHTGLPSYALPFAAAAVGLFAIFLLRQARFEHPLIPLRLFRLPNFTSATLANFLVGFSLFVAIANVPLFINTVVARTLEQGAWESGWVLSALTVPMALAALPGGWLTARRGYRTPAIIGLLVSLIGFILMTAWQQDTPYSVMLPNLILAGCGFGLTIAPIAAAVIDSVPAPFRGTASALVIFFRLMGMTLGVSSMTAYGLYRADILTDRLLPLKAGLNESLQVGMEVAVQVVRETFLFAGLVCVIALLPVIRIRSKRRPKEVENE